MGPTIYTRQHPNSVFSAFSRTARAVYLLSKNSLVPATLEANQTFGAEAHFHFVWHTVFHSFFLSGFMEGALPFFPPSQPVCKDKSLLSIESSSLPSPPPERLVQYVLALPQTMNTAACRTVSSFPGVPPAAQPPQENGLQMQEPAVISLPRALDGLRPSEKSSGPSSPVPATSPVPSGTSHLCPHQIKPLVGSAKRLHSAGSPHACCGAFSLKYRFHSLSSFEAPPNWDAASVGHCVWIPPDWLRAPGRKRGHLSVTGAKPTTWHRASRCELFVGLNHYLIPSPCLFFF